MSPTSRTGGRLKFVLTAVAAGVGVAVAALVLYSVLAPLYLGALASAFDLDERLRSGVGLSVVYPVLAVTFAAPLVAALALTIDRGLTVRRRVPRPGSYRARVPRWNWVLLAGVAAYTLMVTFGALGGRRRRVLPTDLAERIGDTSLATAEFLQQAAYPALALLACSFAYLNWMAWLVPGSARRRAWVYLAGAVLVGAGVTVVAGAQYG